MTSASPPDREHRALLAVLAIALVVLGAVQGLDVAGMLGRLHTAAVGLGAGAAVLGLGVLVQLAVLRLARLPERAARDADEIRRLTAALEARVRERTARLEAANRDLEQLAHVASHDLQEPLRTIEGIARTLSRRLDGRLDVDDAQLLGFLEQAATRGRSMVRDIMRYNAAGGEPTWEPVDPAVLIEGALTQLAAAKQEAKAEVTWDPLPIVSGTPYLLAQVVQNLLANAFRYGDPPVRVHVSAVAGPGQGEVTLRFADRGPGIPDTHKELVFRLFRRGPNAKGDGSGIGLAVCEKIVRQHGGRIRVTDTPGGGATFEVTLRAGSPLRETL